MRFALLWLLLLSPTAFGQDHNTHFEQLRQGAKPMGGLRVFLEQYIGECSEPIPGGGCEERAAAFRKSAQGKRFYLQIPEELATMLSPGNFDAAEAHHSIAVTPFFSAGGYALSQGAPKKTDAQGNPILPLLFAEGDTPADWSESRFQRIFGSRELRVEAVVVPHGLWSLPKRGGGKILGVKSKLEGLRITARGGVPVGFWFAK
jgi:hypothetical protein